MTIGDYPSKFKVIAVWHKIKTSQCVNRLMDKIYNDRQLRECRLSLQQGTGNKGKEWPMEGAGNKSNYFKFFESFCRITF